MRDRLHADVDAVEKAAPSAPLPRFFECPVCGQSVDRRDIEQLYYHNNEPHRPRSVDATRYD